MIISYDRLVQILDAMPDLPNQGVPARQALAITFRQIGAGEVKKTIQFDSDRASLHADLDEDGNLLGIEIL